MLYVGFRCNFVNILDVHNSTGELVYKISPPLCCGGCCYNCIDPKTSSFMCCKVPFYIYPANDVGGKDVGNITKQWGGLATELLTGKSSYALRLFLER
jgi:hypothetical protein